jgi:spore germination protein GerM
VSRRKIIAIAGVAAVAAVVAWVLFVALPRRYTKPTTPTATAPTAASPGRKIKAQLFYVADDGMHLSSVQRDVVYGEGTVEQAREIVNAQLTPPDEPLVSAIPAGTKLRGLYVTGPGQAYVDLSADVSMRHPGGSLAESLTVYTVVQALTANLPAVKSVQLLVDGKEVETLAGHVDLRRPLVRNDGWVVQ